MPCSVPATLKSMSPKWSSSPRISDRTTKRSPSEISPIAMPATDRTIGTPALSRLSVPPHTDAMDDEPLLSRVSETTRTV